MALIRWGNRAVTAITPHAGNKTVLIPPKKKGTPKPTTTAARLDNPVQSAKEVLDQGTEVFSGPPPVGDVKWNPGHYMGPNLGDASNLPTSTLTGRYTDVNNNANIRGAKVWLWWRWLEPTQGNFDWSLVYEHLAALNADKRIIIDIATDAFGSHIDDGACLPDWMRGDRGGFDGFYTSATVDPNGYLRTTCRHEYVPSLAVYFKDLLTAMAAEFDNNDRIEAIILNRESSKGPQITSDPQWQNGTNYVSTMTDIAQHAVTVFAKTNITVFNNAVSGSDSDNKTDQLFNNLKNLSPRKTMMGGPDCAPIYNTERDSTTGTWKGSDNPRQYVYAHYRWYTDVGQYPIMAHIEESTLGINAVGDQSNNLAYNEKVTYFPAVTGEPEPDIFFNSGDNRQQGGYHPKEIFDFLEEIQATHMIWRWQNYAGQDSQKWGNTQIGQLALAVNETLTNTGYPY